MPLLVMPRNLSMETRLFKALSAGETLDELTRRCQEFLERVSGLQQEIGPPFYFATITRAGYRSVNQPSAPT